MALPSITTPAICFGAACFFWPGAATDKTSTDTSSIENTSNGGSAGASHPDTTGSDKKWIAEIRQFIGNRGSEPAEKVFQHIEILKGKPASRLPGMMAALTGLLGVHCSHCHDTGRWESDEKSAKQVTREQFEMQETINKRYFKGEQKVNCWTCHRGHAIPQGLPSAGK